jgi:hypothetical protein
MEGMNVEPTPYGYRAIAMMFRIQILGNIDDPKLKAEATRMFQSYVEIAVYLSHKHPEEYKKLIEEFK